MLRNLAQLEMRDSAVYPDVADVNFRTTNSP
jgi:hypothetical protein